MPKKERIMLDQKVLRDKIYACWLGKNIGGTLGAPIEGRCDFMDIKWFPNWVKKDAFRMMTWICSC